MRFLREQAFYVVLISLTVLIGGAAMVFYATSDIGRKVQQRQAVSTALFKLSRAPEKINQQAVDDLKARNETYQAAAKKAVADSVEFNRKNLKILLLHVEGSEPKPAFPVDVKLYSDKGLTFEFIRQYHRSLDELVGMGRKDLGRTVRPTQVEIDEQKTAMKEKWRDQADVKAIDYMKVRKARDGKVYIDDSALKRYFTREQTTAQFFQLWEAQVNLWVTQELLQAIAATNEELFDWRRTQKIGPSEESVLTSAVKRLEKLDIHETFVPSQKGMANRVGSRGTTDQYGVIGYSFVVIMPPRHIERLLRVLQLQNYHTAMVTTVSEVPLRDRADYYYGVEPVVRVEVEAEMMLLLEWVRSKLPDEVKSKLGQAQPGT